MKRNILAILGGAVLTAAALSTSVAVASIPSSTSGAITSCVSKTSGAVRIIDYQAGKRCKSTERTLGWSSGSTAHLFALPFTAFVGDRTLHKVTNLTVPGAGHWVLAGPVALHVNVTYAQTGQPAISRYLYVSCELHGPAGQFLGGADATMDTDINGGSFENLSLNGILTTTSSSRTASLWCRADLNSPDSDLLVHSQYVWAQIIATKVAGFA